MVVKDPVCVVELTFDFVVVVVVIVWLNGIV
jgi:hypothetical protein